MPDSIPSAWFAIRANLSHLPHWCEPGFIYSNNIRVVLLIMCLAWSLNECAVFSRAVSIATETERPLGDVSKEKAISSRFRVVLSSWYDLSCWRWYVKPLSCFLKAEDCIIILFQCTSTLTCEELIPANTVLQQLRCQFALVQDNFGTSEPVTVLWMSNIVYLFSPCIAPRTHPYANIVFLWHN